MGRFLRFLLFCFLLVSCDVADSTTSFKHDYSELITMNIKYDEVFKIEKELYYIYYYQTSCYHCHGIKSKVIDFAINHSDSFYFVEIIKDEGFTSRTKEDTIGTNDPLKAFALMTPQLSLVKNGIIAETYIGQEEILNIIE